jgi:hypothetical protein
MELLKSPVPAPPARLASDVVGVPVVFQQTPRAETAPPPSFVMLPPVVAMVVEILVTAVVVSVANDAKTPVFAVARTKSFVDKEKNAFDVIVPAPLVVPLPPRLIQLFASESSATRTTEESATRSLVPYVI